MQWGLFALFERYATDTSHAIENQFKLIELVDKLGFDTAWIGEHHFNDFSICPSPTLLLAHAFSRTKSIRLGCAGFLAPFYDAIRLTEEIAMLDILSQGRLNVGFAKGAFAPDSKHFNVTVEHLRPMMLECVEAIDRLLHTKDTPISFQGECLSFSNVDIEPKPLQKELPMFIATFASEETIAFAAKKGYALMLSQGVDLAECERVSRLYKSIAGRAPHIVLLRTLYASSSHEKACLRARPAIDHFAKSMRAASSFHKSRHFDSKKYESLIAERNYFFDGEKFFECGIIGDARACIEKLERIEKTLPNVCVAFKPLGIDLDENSEILRFFNDHVRPHFHHASKDTL